VSGFTATAESWWAALGPASLQLAVVALAAALALRVTRRWPPAVRWWVGAVVLAKMAAPTAMLPTGIVPVAAYDGVAPLWSFFQPIAAAADVVAPGGPGETAVAAAATPAPGTAPAPLARSPSAAVPLFLVYAAGVLLMVSGCCWEWLRLGRLRRTASGLLAPSPGTAALWRAVGGRGAAPRVALSAGVRAPLCFGVWRPTVLLPVGTASPGERRAILAHEFAHLAHRDPLRNVVLTLLAALWWFHPAAWWVGRALRQIQEDRCDDAVLRTAADPTEYGDALVRVARAAAREPRTRLALPMARGEHILSRRLRRIFDPTLSRRTQPVQLLLPASFLVFAAAAPGAAAAPAPLDPPAVLRQDPKPGASAQAIDRALAWLAARQRDDGSFGADPRAADSPATDALVTLSFMGAGQTRSAGPHKQVVAAAIDHLKAVLAQDGPVPEWQRAMCAAAVLEHRAIHGDGGDDAKLASLVESLEKRAESAAVDEREAFWLGLALLSARFGSLDVDAAAVERLRAKLPLGSATPCADWSAETVCAASILLHVFAGGTQEAEGFDAAVERVLAAAGRPALADPDLVHMGSLAMFQVGGATWRAWSAGVLPQLLPADDGSFGEAPSQVATTALITSTLQINYRYARLIK